MFFLPFFHQYVLRRPGVTDEHRAQIFVDCLIDGIGLSSRSRRVTPTAFAERFFSVMSSRGIGRRQVRVKSLASAKADRLGSGWFSDLGIPGNPGRPSFP